MFSIKKYGKNKKKSAKPDIVCVEPTRESVFDILKSNMSKLQRNTFIHRIIYFGSHSFNPGELDNIGKRFKSNIEHINSLYTEEYLTGFLLHYTKYFIHVLDGSESSIRKHLQLLYTSESTKYDLITVKVLVVYHNINQRFLNSWIEVGAKPPHLVHKIKSDLDAQESRLKILMCITKLYKFGYLLRNTEEETGSDDTEGAVHRKFQSSFFEIADDVYGSARPSVGGGYLPSASTLQTESAGGTSGKEINRASYGRFTSSIPELQLMEFLVETPYTLDIHEFLKHYGFIPALLTYADKSWPVQSDYIPHNIFDAEYDPVTDIGAPEEENNIDKIIT